MFSIETDASKTALAALAYLGRMGYFEFIDCQVERSHLTSFGARLISRETFEQKLEIISRKLLYLNKYLSICGQTLHTSGHVLSPDLLRSSALGGQLPLHNLDFCFFFQHFGTGALISAVFTPTVVIIYHASNESCLCCICREPEPRQHSAATSDAVRDDALV